MTWSGVLRDRLDRAIDAVRVAGAKHIKKVSLVLLIAGLWWAWVKHQEHYRHAYREEAVMRHLRATAKHNRGVAKLIEDAEFKVEEDARAYEAMHDY